MRLEDNVKKLIENPFPLWEINVTQELVLNKWKQLNQFGLTNKEDYTTARIWLNNPLLQSDKKILTTKNKENNIFLEMPCLSLKSFYEEHGLEILTEKELESCSALKKLQSAFKILQQVKPVYDCITSLVRTIQVLRNDDHEIDLGYSHPKIPFSIFISVCADDSTISNLRVAESILHEAMHLKLTLIEEIVTIVKNNTGNTYYSPWKNEERPVQGVLHGLFVFRAIYEYCNELLHVMKDKNEIEYLHGRIVNTKSEILSIKNFERSSFFTQIGKTFILSLFSTV